MKFKLIAKSINIHRICFILDRRLIMAAPTKLNNGRMNLQEREDFSEPVSPYVPRKRCPPAPQKENVQRKLDFGNEPESPYKPHEYLIPPNVPYTKRHISFVDACKKDFEDREEEEEEDWSEPDFIPEEPSITWAPWHRKVLARDLKFHA